MTVKIVIKWIRDYVLLILLGATIGVGAVPLLHLCRVVVHGMSDPESRGCIIGAVLVYYYQLAYWAANKIIKKVQS